MHFVQEQQQQQKTFNFLKRALTTCTSGAAILFCLTAMQRSVLDNGSAPNTVTKRHKALLGNVPLQSESYEALCNARLMQLIPGVVCFIAYNRSVNGHAATSEEAWYYMYGVRDTQHVIN